MLSDKADGGDAFPSPGVVINYDKNEYQQGSHGGMSLRDYFAAKAMQAIISTAGSALLLGLEGTEHYVAAGAYQMADAMLLERPK